MIKRYTGEEPEFKHHIKTGVVRGEKTGFNCLNKLYSLKQGSFTMIHAAPHHGKSEFAFELAFNQAERYGKKTLIYSPETGDVLDIYCEFIHKVTGKNALQTEYNPCTDSERIRAMEWINAHFSIVDSDDKAYSFEDLTKLVTDEHIILCDPYNEMKHDMKSDRQDLYIEELMGQIRRYCKKNKKHCLQTLHPAKQMPITEGGMTYYPMPKAREAAGGQANLRKAMTWINMWRPPTSYIDEDIKFYHPDIVLIDIEKAKPKGVSFKGRCVLYFDWPRNRYYELDDKGNRFYAHEHSRAEAEVRLQPNEEFETRDDLPF